MPAGAGWYDGARLWQGKVRISEQLPRVGEVIDVVRFLRDLHPTRARVTRVDASLEPWITAFQIE